MIYLFDLINIILLLSFIYSFVYYSTTVFSTLVSPTIYSFPLYSSLSIQLFRFIVNITFIEYKKAKPNHVKVVRQTLPLHPLPQGKSLLYCNQYEAL